MATLNTTKTIHVTTVVCDICGNRAKNRCPMCKKDICQSHTIYDNEDGFGYSDRCCTPCYAAGEKYRTERKRLEEECEAAISKLEAEWRSQVASQSTEYGDKVGRA